MKKIFVIIYIIISSTSVMHAQSDSTETEFDEELQDSLDQLREEKPHLVWHLGYLSDIVYNGRRLDSLPQWGLNISLHYKLKHGFKLMYDGAIWSDAEKPYALTNLGVEKVFTIGDHWEISTSLNRFYYNNGTRAEKNYFNKSADASVGYSWNGFYISWYSSYMWGTVKTYYHNPSVLWTYEKWLGHVRPVKWKSSVEFNLNYGRGDAAARAIAIKRAKAKAAKTKTNTKPVLSKDAAYVGILCYTFNFENEFKYKDHFINILISANKPVGPSTDGKWLYYWGLEWKKNIFF